METITITPTAIFHLVNGGALAVWREQVSYVRGRRTRRFNRHGGRTGL